MVGLMAGVHFCLLGMGCCLWLLPKDTFLKNSLYLWKVEGRVR